MGVTDRARKQKVVQPEDEFVGPVAIEAATGLPVTQAQAAAFLPADWWRWFFRPSSGRYEGDMVWPRTGRRALDLRVDVDSIGINSPVMDRISGDFYQVYRIWGHSWRVYRESWIVDAPSVKRSTWETEITGRVRFWQGTHPGTSVRVRIPRSWFGRAGPAEVAFLDASGRPTSTYSCPRLSSSLRELSLEVDVCASVNAAPILPEYDTHAHPTRPNIPRRTLTIEGAYREEGVRVTVRPDHTVIDDSADQFTTWSVAELHDAMETYFSQYTGRWPAWQMWGLLAGSFDSSGTAGIMFDASAIYGGAGEPPDRQGFAVFRNHSWFANLPGPDGPTNDAEAEAMRDYLYTWVHEAGHAFNFLHSWDKGRPDSLSWMNYPWRYDNRNGAGSYWSDFEFRFDDEELIHLRHGDRASVIMGGDPWASGGHLEAPSGSGAQLEGQPPIEFLLRSKENFEFMEPVELEFRVRSLLEDSPLELDTRLRPEFGGVSVHIRRPDGRIVQYAPITSMLGTPRLQTLKPFEKKRKGEDRYSENVFLGYGKYGFDFEEPGEYLVRAMYQGGGEVLIPSNVHRIRIGSPSSKEEEEIGRSFFTYQVGMGLYLSGSRSPHLEEGMAVLESIVSDYSDTYLGAKVAERVAPSFSRPFFRVEDGVLTQTHSAEPERALALTAPGVALYGREEATWSNIPHHQLVRQRAANMITLGQMREAREELQSLREILEARGVNKPVLSDIQTYAESTGEEAVA